MPYAHVVSPGDKVDLSKFSPSDKGGLTKEEGHAKRDEIGARITKLQTLLFAAAQHSLLIVVQGRDTSGKDGAINRILSYLNVQSTRVASFKVPTERELAHDFLWRVHAQTPGKSEISIFNRSHYEDVLVVRVHELVPEEVWKARYEQINEFESLLTSASTIVLKFYLHIDSEEQESRLIAREKDPEKSWKLSVSDWKERDLWPDYEKAYEDVLSKCSTAKAPWRIVSANHKWFRDLSIAEAIADTLEPYVGGWEESLRELGETRLAELAEYRKSET
jgi:PPK2 family polyphosphate:nucleotide phosphotransferase